MKNSQSFKFSAIRTVRCESTVNGKVIYIEGTDLTVVFLSLDKVVHISNTFSPWIPHSPLNLQFRAYNTWWLWHIPLRHTGSKDTKSKREASVPLSPSRTTHQ